jgi:WD40 repeat protein
MKNGDAGSEPQGCLSLEREAIPMNEVLVKLLFQYGPFAILVLYVSVTIPQALKFFKKTPQNKNGTARFILIANWIAFFVISAICIYVWVEFNVKDAAIIQGQLIGLPEGTSVTSPFQNLYLRRVYGQKERADFLWAIIRSQKLPRGEPIDFYIQEPGNNNPPIYKLPVDDDMYNDVVVLTYHAATKKLCRERGREQSCLEKRDLISGKQQQTNQAEGSGFQWIPTVHAQGKTDLTGMSARLDSNDPVVREGAWKDLVAVGQDASDYVSRVLSDPKSSSRLRLSVLVALNDPKAKWSLTQQANCAILHAVNNPDPTLKEQADKYVSAHRDLPDPAHCTKSTAISSPGLMPTQPDRISAIELNEVSEDLSIEALTAHPDLLRVAQTLKGDPKLSLALLLYDLSETHSANLPWSRQQKLALQNLLWDNGWLPTYKISEAHAAINGIAVSPDGKLLAVALDNRSAQIWEMSSGKQLHSFEGHRSSVRSVAFSNDGARLATAGRDGLVKLWDVKTGDDVGIRLQNGTPLIRVMFSPDDSLLLTQDTDRRVAVWSASDGRKLYQLPLVGIQPITTIAFVQDSGLLASGHFDGQIRFWDAKTGQPKKSLRDFTDGISSLNFSADGTKLFAVSSNKADSVAKWIDIQTDRIIRTYSGSRKQVTIESGNLDQGGLLLAGTSYSNLKIWQAVSGDDIAILHGHRNWRSTFEVVPLSPMTLICWNKDTVRVMPLDFDELVRAAKGFARTISASECNQYLKASTCPALNLP